MDTAERLRIEQALRESEERAQALLDRTSEGIIISEGGRILEVNAGGAELLRAKPQDLIGRSVLDFTHPDSRELVAAHVRAGYELPYEAVGLRADGSPYVGLIHAKMVQYGGRTVRITVIRDLTEQRAAERALRESEERFRRIFEVSPISVAILRERDLVFLDANPDFLHVSGWTREEVLGRSYDDLGMWPNAEIRTQLLARFRERGILHDVEWQMRAKSGQLHDMLGSAERIRIGDDDCVVVVGQDVTERVRIEAEMRKLSRALAQTADAVMITDRRGRIEYVNEAFERTTGFSREEAVGGPPNIVKSGRHASEFYRRLWTTILGGETFSDVFINRRKDGTTYYEEKRITPLKDNQGNITHFISSGRDISERMATQERLQYLAHHDTLTDLPNRALFLDRVRQALARARWHRRLVAVLFVDLDRFKIINDTLGHDVGDRLLKMLGERFRTSLRDGDTVARFGGDEFAILLEDVAAASDVSGVAKKILDALAPPFTIDGRELFVTASIGVSIFPEDGEDSGALLKHADIAMYRAKDLGKNTYQFYSAEMGAKAFERLTLESSLRRALERGEFRLHYQPQVCAHTGAVTAVEALIRWQHPDLGLVSPADFIPLLEDTGLIVPVGEWVLATACAQARAWHNLGMQRLRVSVNVSARQFTAPDFTGVVERVLRDSGLPAETLELEMTESVIMRQTEETLAVLEALNRLGVRLAVDDFGTGYSSLGYLRRFPLDTLKIDRTFVRDVPQDPDDAAIVTAVLAMALSLKLEAVAEGVETSAQLAFLRAHGCRSMQGFYFSPAVPAEDIPALVRNGITPVR